MAISFVGSAENSAVGGPDITLDLSGLGLQEGDLVIVASATGNDDNTDFDMAMVTAGYTEVADLFANDVFDSNLAVFWKVMGATPDTDAVVDGRGDTTSAQVAIAMVFRGVDETTPMDVTPTTATGIDTAHPNPPSIDHNNPSGVWTVAAGSASHGDLDVETFTAPTNYVNLVDIVRRSDASAGVLLGMASRPDPADPEDPGIFDPSGGFESANAAWCAATLALRPAAAAGQAPRSIHQYGLRRRI